MFLDLTFVGFEVLGKTSNRIEPIGVVDGRTDANRAMAIVTVEFG